MDEYQERCLDLYYKGITMKWYEHPEWTKHVPELKKIVPQFRYEHRGESLRVYDDQGMVASLRSWDQAMDFRRIVLAVATPYENLLAERTYYA